MTEQTTFALIGTGRLAQSQHLPNLMRAPHVKLQTICDTNEELLAAMHAKYPVPQATTDYREVLADPSIQAVVIATREDMQAKLTIAALEAGKHVYVEKPLANTSEECQAVVDAQKRSGKHVALGLNRRFAPAYRKAREAVMAHGGAHNIHYRISETAWHWHDPMRSRVITEVCHIFDILRWFTDSEVSSVYCMEARDDDEAFALQFENGAIATIMSTGYSSTDLPKERIEIISDTGGVIVEEFAELRTFGYSDFDHVYRFAGHAHPDQEWTPKYLLAQSGADAVHALRRMAWELQEEAKENVEDKSCSAQDVRDYVNTRVPIWNYMGDKGWLSAVDHFAQCILEGRTPETATAEDAWKASCIAHAAIRSRDEKNIVKL